MHTKAEEKSAPLLDVLPLFAMFGVRVNRENERERGVWECTLGEGEEIYVEFMTGRRCAYIYTHEHSSGHRIPDHGLYVASEAIDVGVDVAGIFDRSEITRYCSKVLCRSDD